MRLDQFLGQWIDLLLDRFQQAILWIQHREFLDGFNHLKELLGKGLEPAALWLHLIAGCLAFTSDVLKRLARSLTKILMWGGTGSAAGSFVGLETGYIGPELGAGIFVFSLSLAFLCFIMLMLQRVTGKEGENKGALAALIPAIEGLQSKLDSIFEETKWLRQEQEHLGRRAQEQHKEAMAGQAETQTQLQELKRLVNAIARDKAEQAAEAGLGQDTILQLARRIKPEVIGLEQAVKELEYAVGIAVDVIAKGERGTNQEAFVEEVLKRLAETTKRGEYDAGTKTVDDALAELDRRDEESRQSLRRSRETLLEAGVEQDLLRRDPTAVARRIEAIAALETTNGNPAWSPKYRGRWDAFFAEGEEKGINLSLAVAIEMARHMAAGAANADQRGTALNLLGNALLRLGERESGTARLEAAVLAYRAALKEYTRARVPLDWAMTQMNLGNALVHLGERESGTEKLKEAVAAYGAALKEYIRARLPLQSAMTQNNVGLALSRLGERESGTAWLKKAVAAYRAALKELTQERVPLEWAGTQNNLGLALRRLGERESGTARFEEAVSAYREALKEYTQERVPLDWAMTQNNLGAALSSLGERESGTAQFEEAVSAYREALKERTRERVPLDWAMSTGNKGVALMRLAERKKDLLMATTALKQIEGAFEVTRAGSHAPNAAYYRSRLDEARALVDRLKAH